MLVESKKLYPEDTQSLAGPQLVWCGLAQPCWRNEKRATSAFGVVTTALLHVRAGSRGDGTRSVDTCTVKIFLFILQIRVFNGVTRHLCPRQTISLLSVFPTSKRRYLVRSVVPPVKERKIYLNGVFFFGVIG